MVDSSGQVLNTQHKCPPREPATTATFSHAAVPLVGRTSVGVFNLPTALLPLWKPEHLPWCLGRVSHSTWAMVALLLIPNPIPTHA
jgi:hypothetical protein